jgi:hypothetical protein
VAAAAALTQQIFQHGHDGRVAAQRLDRRVRLFRRELCAQMQNVAVAILGLLKHVARSACRGWALDKFSWLAWRRRSEAKGNEKEPRTDEHVGGLKNLRDRGRVAAA